MRLPCLLIVLTATTLALSAEDWPWFGGPGSSRSSAYDGALIEDPAKAKLVWESADTVPTSHPDKPRGSISGGFSSPVLADGRLYVFYFVPAGPVAADAEKRRAKDQSPVDKWRIGASDVVHCFDAKTGKTLWKRVYENKGVNYNNESAKVGGHFTPAVGGGMVFAVGTTGRVYAMDAVSGEPAWEADLGSKHEAMEAAKAKGIAANRMPVSKRFGLNDIPVYAGGAVAIGDGHGGVVAFDAESGKELWHKRASLPKHSGPISWREEGRELFLLIADARRGGQSSCVDPLSGKELWSTDVIRHDKPFAAVSGTTLVTSDSSTSKKEESTVGLHAYRLTTGGVEPLWDLEDSQRAGYGMLKTQCPVILGDHAYAVCGVKNMTEIRLVAVELATGKKTDEVELPKDAANWWSSLVGGGDLLFQENAHRILFFSAQPGEVRLLGELEGSKITNTVGPIFADGLLYVRGHDRLRCYDLRR